MAIPNTGSPEMWFSNLLSFAEFLILKISGLAV